MINPFKYLVSSSSEDLIPWFKFYEAYLWRHSFAPQRRYPKSLYVAPFETGYRYQKFGIISDINMIKGTLAVYRDLQNSIGRSGKCQRVQIFRCRLISRVLMEIYRSLALIVQRDHTDSAWPLLLFIGW